MPLQECTLNLDHEKRELMPHGTVEFPCAAYRDRLCSDEREDIPWHWHEEIEVVVVERGTLIFETPTCLWLMEEGQGVLINSNTLHRFAGTEAAELYSLVFHKRLIAGDESSVFGKKYVDPILSNSDLSSVSMNLRAGWHQEALEAFQSAFLAMEEGADGYELLVREHLTHMWYLIYTENKEALEQMPGKADTDSVRVKQMLDYIHASYSGPVTLAEIAASAHIGSRECLRCFNRTVGIPPMQFLQKHRIFEAARMLASTDLPISEVAGNCGFDSPSNFSRTFKKYYRITPAEYRKRRLEEDFPNPYNIMKTQ